MLHLNLEGTFLRMCTFPLFDRFLFFIELCNIYVRVYFVDMIYCGLFLHEILPVMYTLLRITLCNNAHNQGYFLSYQNTLELFVVTSLILLFSNLCLTSASFDLRLTPSLPNPLEPLLC